MYKLFRPFSFHNYALSTANKISLHMFWKPRGRWAQGSFIFSTLKYPANLSNVVYFHVLEEG